MTLALVLADYYSLPFFLAETSVVSPPRWVPGLLNYTRRSKEPVSPACVVKESFWEEVGLILPRRRGKRTVSECWLPMEYLVGKTIRRLIYLSAGLPRGSSVLCTLHE